MLLRGWLVACALVAACMFGAQAHAADAAPAAAPAAPAAGEYKVDLPDDQSKLSYALGLQLGESLKSSGLGRDTLNMDLLMKGFNDALDGKKGMPDADRKNAIRNGIMKSQDAVAEKNLAAGKTFLEGNAKKDGVKTTASGLQYQVMTEGTGKKPAATNTVKVNYLGTLIDGTKFDSSYDRGEPAEFQLDQVIKGWTEGLQLMSEGSKYKFWIPAEIAYGKNSRPPIPPNSTLIFEVELLSITK